MRFVTVRDIRSAPAKVWQQLQEEQEVIVTNNGRPIGLLTPLSDENLEETVSAVRRARAGDALRRLQEGARAQGLDRLSIEDIDAEVQEVREQREEQDRPE